jgi:ribosome-binding factor A
MNPANDAKRLDSGKRRGRTVELVAHQAAMFIKEVAGSESLITVTRALASTRGEHITVFVSVFPEDKEVPALSYLARQREAFSDHLKAHSRLRPLPRVDFELDRGEKNRRRLDELSGA